MNYHNTFNISSKCHRNYYFFCLKSLCSSNLEGSVRKSFRSDKLFYKKENKNKKIQHRSNHSFFGCKSWHTDRSLCFLQHWKPERRKKKTKTLQIKSDFFLYWNAMHWCDIVGNAGGVFFFLPLCEQVLVWHCWRLLWSQRRRKRGQ